MNLLKTSWKRSLAAAVVTSVTVSLSGPAGVAESSAEESATVAVAQAPSRDAPRTVERQRVEGALGELQERAGAIERELRELGDGHPERAEALKREFRSLRERMQQLRQSDGPGETRRAESAVRELQERISATERQLHELRGEQPDKAEALARELNGMRERMRQLRSRAAEGEGQRAEGAIRELQERGSVVERELRELGDRHPDKAESLKRELIGIRERIQELRQRAGEDRRLPEGARRELQERAGALERELRELGNNHPDRAEAIKRELNQIRVNMSPPTGEAVRVAPPATSREIDELRNQVREMRQEMEALRAEVRRLVERETRERN